MARAVPHNHEQPLTIIELGSGASPLNVADGGVFDRRDVRYIGFDVSPNLDLGHKAWNSTHERPHAFVRSMPRRLPVASGVVDEVVMRSVFGQYCLMSDVHLTDVRMWTCFEAFRVLKSGGKITVLEENTPMPAYLVEGWLKEAGFRCTRFGAQPPRGDQRRNDPHDPWTVLRSRWANDRVLQDETHDSLLRGAAYALEAERPVEAQIQLGRIGGYGEYWCPVEPGEPMKYPDAQIYEKGAENTDASIVAGSYRGSVSDFGFIL